MANIAKKIIVEQNVSPELNSEITVEFENVVTTTKSIVKKVPDISGGKVQIFTEGYQDGETVNMTVNGKTQDVEILGNFGIFSSGGSFTQFPAIIIND